MKDNQRKAMFAKMNSGKDSIPNPTITFARHPENLSTSQFKRVTAKGTPNATSVRELELYTTNDADLYRQQHTPIIKNLERKMQKGQYDRDKAKLAFLNLVESGSKKYKKEFGTENDVIFTKADKLAVASRLEKDFREESKLGNYRNLVPAKVGDKFKDKEGNVFVVRETSRTKDFDPNPSIELRRSGAASATDSKQIPENELRFYTRV